jgi:hypothetical protein
MKDVKSFLNTDHEPAQMIGNESESWKIMP